MSRLFGNYMLFLALLPWAESVMLDFSWPKVKMGLKRFPHPESCSYYYSIGSDGDYTLKECGKGQSFDYITLTCARDTLAHCWRNMLDPEYRPVLIPKPFKCPFAWGVYPDITDCSKYFICHGGKYRHRKCSASKRFDKIEEACVAESKAMCADESDVVEESYKCPYTWGAFSHSKDCSKYYECFDDKPFVRTCKVGTLFDSQKERCRRKEGVDCGTRYNPYDEKINIPTSNVMTSKESTEATVGRSIVGEVSTASVELTSLKLGTTANLMPSKETTVDKVQNSIEEIIFTVPKLQTGASALLLKETTVDSARNSIVEKISTASKLQTGASALLLKQTTVDKTRNSIAEKISTALQLQTGASAMLLKETTVDKAESSTLEKISTTLNIPTTLKLETMFKVIPSKETIENKNVDKISNAPSNPNALKIDKRV